VDIGALLLVVVLFESEIVGIGGCPGEHIHLESYNKAGLCPGEICERVR